MSQPEPSLQDVSSPVRCAAVRRLGDLGPAGAQHADEVAAKLEDPSGRVRCAAIEALASMEAGALRADIVANPNPYPILMEARADAVATRLHDTNVKVRCTAVRALGEMGETGADHIDEVAAMLSDKSVLVRGIVIDAVAKMQKFRQEPRAAEWWVAPTTYW